MKIKSDFAILDVKAGRAKLFKRVSFGKPVKVVIEGEIDSHWGRDDGTSQEFNVNVKSVKVKS